MAKNHTFHIPFGRILYIGKANKMGGNLYFGFLYVAIIKAIILIIFIEEMCLIIKEAMSIFVPAKHCGLFLTRQASGQLSFTITELMCTCASAKYCAIIVTMQRVPVLQRSIVV